MRVEKQIFGHPYETLYTGVVKLFGHDDHIVLEAEHDCEFIVIEDFGANADYNDPDFEEVMNEQAAVRAFATAEERDAYLKETYVADRPWLRQRIDEARRSFRSR